MLIEEELLLQESEISSFSDDERLNGVNPDRYGGRRFVPFDKGGNSDARGGWLPN
jgi:hypothetical protein